MPNYFCLIEICNVGRKEERKASKQEGTETEQKNMVILTSNFFSCLIASTIESALLELLAE